MKTRETTTPVRAFDCAYINGQFITPHGTQIVDLVSPTDNKVIGKVTMADAIDTRKAIGAAKEAFNSFSQSNKAYRMQLLQRLHDAVAKPMDQLVEATVVEYGAPQDRAKGSNNLAANIFLPFKKVLEDFDLLKTVGTSKVVMEPVGVVGIFTPWNSSAGSIAIKVAPAIAAECTVVIKPSEMSAMQTEVSLSPLRRRSESVSHGLTGHALLRAAASRRRVNGVMISPAPRSRGATLVVPPRFTRFLPPPAALPHEVAGQHSARALVWTVYADDYRLHELVPMKGTSD